MKRIFFIICMVILVPLATNAAVITFDKVTTYTDGSTIPTAKQALIVYKAFYGPTQTGPWTAGASSTGTEIVAPDPAAGSTGWFTVSASLDGQESAKCAPASKTVAPLIPASPPGCTVR